jgi:hypothetical protein
MPRPGAGKVLAGKVAAQVLEEGPTLSRAFAAASPFRHVVIDDFLEPAFAQRLLEQFPGFEQGNFLSEDGRPGSKSTFERVRALGDGYAALDDLIRSQDFLQLLGTLTDIDQLLYDPWYLGGGTHENRHEGGLEAHIDFNFHPLERWHRRLNLIVYLNPGWEDQWGGALELYRDPAGEADQAIAPVFNRCVIFETNEHSWHGFNRIVLPEDRRDLARKSIALYFYTQAADDARSQDAHSTVYVNPPLPSRLQPGHVLTAQDVADMLRLLGDRDNRIAMQYREITKLMTLVRAHERGLAGSMLYAARRLHARMRRRQRD